MAQVPLRCLPTGYTAVLFPASIQLALGESPTTLDEMYERILLGIDEEKREHAIHLFQCLAFSRRPLRAKRACGDSRDSFRRKRFSEVKRGLAPVRRRGGRAVSMFAFGHHDEENEDCDPRLLQFSHHSAESERLAGSERRELSPVYVPPELAHAILAQSCISTVLQLDIHSQDTAHGLPHSKYAARNWFRHAQGNGVALEDDPDGIHLAAARVSIHDA